MKSVSNPSLPSDIRSVVNDIVQSFGLDYGNILPKLDMGVMEREMTTPVALERYWKFCAKTCADLALTNPTWSTCAGKILTRWIHLQNTYSFSEFTAKGTNPQGLSIGHSAFVQENAKILDEWTNIELDFDYPGACTLIQSYLYKIKHNNDHSGQPLEVKERSDGKTPEKQGYIMETPAMMYMRVASFLHSPDLALIKELFDVISQKKASFGSPVYFNAATRRPSMSSCFLTRVGDSMGEISESWKEAALLSMNKGGIGMDYSQLRHSEIGVNGGVSRGILPWAKIHNEIMNAVDQGSVRKGSATVFLRDYHTDLIEFMELRKANGAESMRARDLFLAVSLSDLFWERVARNEKWSFFCPNKCPGLANSFGDKFRDLYAKYERQGLATRTVPARDVHRAIYKMQSETGMPFIIDLDNINRKNMQSNIGDIYQSNLCVEIVQHTSEKELASCNLASVCYPTHIKSTAKGNKVDWLSLAHTVRVMIKALNQIIDRNYYPEELPKIKHTNLKNRPIALGEQGLADLFAMLDLSWEEPKTRKLYYRLQETQYYWALMESCELAAMDGPYPAFAGSPYSRGTLHTDLCDAEGKAPDHPEWSRIDSSLWSRLRQRIVRVGVRNSLLRAKMPTATTAYMIGNNESFEPFTHLIYTRRLLSGKFTHVNKYLYDDIMKKCPEIWNEDTVANIITSGGSVKNLVVPGKPEVQDRLRTKYKTVFELAQSLLIRMNIDTVRFVDQSSSMNLYFEEPSYQKVLSCHTLAHNGGLKTLQYYMRTLPPTTAINFGIKKSLSPDVVSPLRSSLPRRIEPPLSPPECNQEICTSCGA